MFAERGREASTTMLPSQPAYPSDFFPLRKVFASKVLQPDEVLQVANSKHTAGR